MKSVGWNIHKQSKNYGKYVDAEIDGDNLHIKVKDNLLGLRLSEGTLPLPVKTDTIDRICFCLSSMLEEMDMIHKQNEVESCKENQSSNTTE